MDVMRFLIWLVIVRSIDSLSYENASSNSSCRAALSKPNVLSSLYCRPLITSASYCQSRGVQISSRVFVADVTQRRNNKKLERMVKSFKLLQSYKPTLEVRKACRDAVDMFYCHHYFPSCDQTGSVEAEMTVCHETCEYLWRECDKELEIAQQLNHQSFQLLYPYRWDIINCSQLDMRNAGQTPECWYYTGDNHVITANSTGLHAVISTTECVYRDGSGYQGNVSVTSSGRRCQSWGSQCPHRHMMNSTYPELNSAENYCRNACGSGNKPWCFTTENDTRWEYCDIPKCVPVNGGYSEWKMGNKCNFTCGHGVEVWRRSCDSPAPQYDGNDCTSLGSAVEYRACKDLPPCPVNGRYGQWQANTTCNTTCGEGYMQWVRSCDNPSPAHGGQNCSRLGNAMKWELCKELIVCDALKSDALLEKTTVYILVGVSAGVFLVLFIVLGRFVYRKWQNIIMKDFEPYATFNFGMQDITTKSPANDTNEPTESERNSCPAQYGNLTASGDPIPGKTTGMIPYKPRYVNTENHDATRYAKLHLLSSIAIDWTRNIWGQVDKLGKHVYDVLFPRVRIPNFVYSKTNKISPSCAGNTAGATDDTDNVVYDRLNRSEPPGTLTGNISVA